MSIKKFIYEFIYEVPPERVVTKFRCDFVTTDEKEHSYNGYNWMEEAAFYNPIRYLCDKAHRKGYLWDDDRVAYPMENVRSFKMVPVAKGKVTDCNKYKIFFLMKKFLIKCRFDLLGGFMLPLSFLPRR